MPDDAELLHRYAEEGSQDAFRELVRRHINLVYTAALRRTDGDSQRAQDVSQIVFTDLARRARSLAFPRALTGWLYTATKHAAIKLMVSERRRRAREVAADVIAQPAAAPEIDWKRIRPILDQEMDRLGSADRDAILLRYFENRSFKEVSEVLKVTEDSARMRISRALEKLRGRLARVGITPGTAALGALLVENATTEAPTGAANGISTAALAGGSAGITGFEIIAAIAGGKIAIGAAAAAAAFSIGVLTYRRANLPNARPDLSSRASVISADAIPSAAVASVPAEPIANLSLAAILAEPDQLKAFGLYARRLLQLRPEEFDAEFPSLRQVQKADQREMFLQLFLKHWGTIDPRGALAALDRRRTSGPGDANSVEYLDYLRFTSAVYKGWAAANPLEAVEAAAAATADLAWAAETRARTTTSTQPAAFGRAVTAASYRRDRIKDAIGAVIESRRFEDAAVLLLSHPAYSNAFREHFGQAAPVGQTAPIMVDSALVQKLAASWAMADPVGAAKWISQDYPATSDRALAIIGFLKAVGPENPDIANSMISSLDAVRRSDAARALVEGYIEQGSRTGAYNWLTTRAGENTDGEWDGALEAYIGLSASAGKLLEASAGDRAIIRRIRNPNTRGAAAMTFAMDRVEIAPRESLEVLQEYAPESVKWRQSSGGPANGPAWPLNSIPGIVGIWAYFEYEQALNYARTAPGYTDDQRAAMTSMAQARAGGQK